MMRRIGVLGIGFLTVLLFVTPLRAQSMSGTGGLVYLMGGWHQSGTYADPRGGAGFLRVEGGVIRGKLFGLPPGQKYVLLLFDDRTRERKVIAPIALVGGGNAKLGQAIVEVKTGEELAKYTMLAVEREGKEAQFYLFGFLPGVSGHSLTCGHSDGVIFTSKTEQMCYECPCGYFFQTCDLRAKEKGLARAN
mgnify:CR=1 FL=1